MFIPCNYFRDTKIAEPKNSNKNHFYLSIIGHCLRSQILLQFNAVKSMETYDIYLTNGHPTRHFSYEHAHNRSIRLTDVEPRII